MTIQEIKAAVDAGKKVQWCTPVYEVIKDKNGEYLIHCATNGHYIALTNQTGDKLNGDESEFSVVPLNGYKALYEGKEKDIYAATLYEAKLKAIEHFKPPKKKLDKVIVMLCEKSDGSQVVHTPDF